MWAWRGDTGRIDRLCICMFADEIDGFRILCHALNYKIPTQGGESEGKEETSTGIWVNTVRLREAGGKL